MDWIVWQAIIDYVAEFWDRRLYPGKMWPNVNVWTDGRHRLCSASHGDGSPHRLL